MDQEKYSDVNGFLNQQLDVYPLISRTDLHNLKVWENPRHSTVFLCMNMDSGWGYQPSTENFLLSIYIDYLQSLF